MKPETEAEQRRNAWASAQGRFADVPMPEIPSFRNPWTWLLGAIVIIATISASMLADWGTQ